MQRYWSQIAMVLLGVSLTVGFYEGRRMVKNTAKAFTAATSISGQASGRRRDRDADAEDPGDEEEDDFGVASAADDERGGKRGKKAVGRFTPLIPGDPGDPRGDKINMIRQRQRQRLAGRPGGPIGPVVTAPPREEPADAPVDTGATDPPPPPPGQ